MLRVTINGSSKATSIHRRVPERLWCTASNRVKGNSEQATALNLYIDNIKAKAVQAYSYVKNTEEFPTCDTVMDRLLGKSQGGQQGAIELFERHLYELQEQVGTSCSPSHFQKNVRIKNYLNEFLKSKHGYHDLPISKITNDHIQGFYAFLRSQKGHSHNTAVKNMRIFKKITNRAFRSGWIKMDPFFGFSMGLQKTDPVFLTQDEVDRIMTLKPKTERLQKIRDFFIVSCYTGLAFVDIHALRVKDIVQSNEGLYWIKTKRAKTQIKARIPILPIPMRIIEKYCDITTSEGSQRVFPIGSNQKTNEYLREIADLAGIHKKVTYHAARHTFATTITLENGIPIESVSKMLGHADIKTTQHYARVLDSKIGKDMEILRDNHLRIA